MGVAKRVGSCTREIASALGLRCWLLLPDASALPELEPDGRGRTRPFIELERVGGSNNAGAAGAPPTGGARGACFLAFCLFSSFPEAEDTGGWFLLSAAAKIRVCFSLSIYPFLF